MFFSPSKAEKEKLVRTNNEKSQIAEVKKKKDAAKRKAVRDATKLNAKRISFEVKSSVPTASQEISERVATFLTGPYFFGRSSFENKEFVSVTCGTGQERTFDRDRKLWGTNSVVNLRKLLVSHKFSPFGLLPCDLDHALAVVEARIDALGIPDPIIASPAENAGVCDPLSPTPSAEASVAAPQKKREEDLSIESTAAEVAKCQRLQFDETVVKESKTWLWLGPNSGMSSEGRLLRWIDIFTCTQRELSGFFFDKERLKPFLNRKIAEEVARINAWNYEK